MIDLHYITFQYPEQKPIFKDFSWVVNRGQTWAILGPSGCGKSTLLYLLAGLQKPSAGRVLIDNQPIERPRPQTGLIIQEYGLLPWATVRQNATLGIRIRDFYGPDGTHSPEDYLSDPSVDHWLDRLRLTPHANKYPSQLSGGQRQRTAIARTLVLEPDLILMDEPFSSLDAPTREALQNLTLDLQSEQNLTMIIVTHAIEEAAILGKNLLLLGHPPNTNLEIIENPGAGSQGYRDSDDYVAVCRQVRTLLDEGQQP